MMHCEKISAPQTIKDIGKFIIDERDRLINNLSNQLLGQLYWPVVILTLLRPGRYMS